MGSPEVSAAPPRAALVRAMIDWFEAHARDLPWRRTADPYGIWVSEVMLQQTQVRTVIPYWEGWLKALPNVQALAAANESSVLKLWEGLGYYRRARHLQKAATVIVERHDGVFPTGFADILELPGVGRYTAGAIASIAFNQPQPILDGNVIRVLTRIHGLRGDPRSAKLNALLWAEAGALVEAAARSSRRNACSHFNQSLMELGATRCLPRDAKCGECPVSQWCRARAVGQVEEFPESGARPATTQRRMLAFVARVGDRYCVRQRERTGVNGGLWEFPNVEVRGRWPGAGAVARELFGVTPQRIEVSGEVRHSITRYRITQRIATVEFRRMTPRLDHAGMWRTLPELDRLAFTSAHRRLVDRLVAPAEIPARSGTAKLRESRW